MITRDDLTRGEWLWIHRRRANASVADRAREYGVSEDTYRTWERDRVQPDTVPRLHRLPANVTYGEYSAIMRRRKGWSMTKVAKLRGTTKMTIWKQEHDLTSTAIELANWWRTTQDAPLYFPSPR